LWRSSLAKEAERSYRNDERNHGEENNYISNRAACWSWIRVLLIRHAST